MKLLLIAVTTMVITAACFAVVAPEEEIIPFGGPGGKPYLKDFDGDTILDPTIYDPATGLWYIKTSTGGYQVIWWGVPGAIPVPDDYDGDGKTDLAVYYPDTLSWYINGSTDGIITTQWGHPGCIPTPGDFDNDGKVDAGFYLPDNWHWYLHKNRASKLEQGLVAYYPFNGNADDMSGHGNNGTVQGAQLCPDRNGNDNAAYYFDGNDYIEVAPSDSLFFNTISISTWLKLDTTIGPNIIVSKWDDHAFEHTFTLKDWNQNSKLAFELSQGNHNDLGYHDSVADLPIDEWVFVTAVFDNSSMSLYFNGVFDSSTAVSGSISNHDIPMLIGALMSASGSTGEYFDGVIDELRIYNRALSQDEIMSLYLLDK